MGRNFLKGKDGDRINAILAGCGFNIKKLPRATLLWLFCGFSKNGSGAV